MKRQEVLEMGLAYKGVDLATATENEKTLGFLELEVDILLLRANLMYALISNMEEMLLDWGFDINEFTPVEKVYRFITEAPIERFFSEESIGIVYESKKGDEEITAFMFLYGLDIEKGIYAHTQDIETSGYIVKTTPEGQFSYDGEKWVPAEEKENENAD